MRTTNFFWIMVLLSVLMLSGCTSTAKPQESDTADFSGELKEFRVEAFQFGFEPSVIEVNLGDKVRIVATSRDIPHGFAIPEFGVNLYLDGLREQTTEFVADKRGTFTFFCSVPCGKGHGKMKGELIVN